ncbi:hypothetical protein HK102_003329 [Quaeritorhiza haematococci]|nr:hypothetical protein HK102_003329 [Quaeritorhiza haematococci]
MKTPPNPERLPKRARYSRSVDVEAPESQAVRETAAPANETSEDDDAPFGDQPTVDDPLATAPVKSKFLVQTNIDAQGPGDAEKHESRDAVIEGEAIGQSREESLIVPDIAVACNVHACGVSAVAAEAVEVQKDDRIQSNSQGDGPQMLSRQW